jgi:hypothetical protein
MQGVAVAREKVGARAENESGFVSCAPPKPLGSLAVVAVLVFVYGG